jgi:hypothetical protein
MNPHSNFSEILPDVRAERAEVRSLNQHGHSVQMGAAVWPIDSTEKIAKEGATEGEDRRAKGNRSNSKNGAVERIRTFTVLLPPAPQAGASASSATTAKYFAVALYCCRFRLTV